MIENDRPSLMPDHSPIRPAWVSGGLLAYVLAIALTLATLLVRLALGLRVDDPPILIIFTLPIIISAYLGGIGPGLLATVIAALLANYVLLPQLYAFSFAIRLDLIQTGGLIIAGTLISVLSEELRRAWRQAESSRQLYALTLASIGDAVITTDLQGQVSFMNAEARRLTGWTSHAAAGRSLAAVFQNVDAQTRAPADDPAAMALRNGGPTAQTHNTLLIACDGRETPIEDRGGAPIKDAAGVVRGVVLVFRDITDRMRAEQALLQSEDRFSKAFRASLTALAITRASDARFIDMNTSFLHLLEYTPAEMIGQNALELQIFPDLDDLAAIGCLLHEKGVIYNREATNRTKSGQLRNVLFSAEAIEVDREPCFLITLIDITDRKRAEQTLQQHTARLQVLADTSRAFAEAREDYQALLDRIARMTAAALGEGCSIRLISDDGMQLPIVALYDVDPEKLELHRIILCEAPLRMDEPSLSLRVVQSRQPLLVSVVDREQVRATTKPELWSLVDRLGIHSLLVVPLRVQGLAIGILGLYRHRREQPSFTENDLTLAQDLADRAALAISNARLYNELQQSHAALEARVVARTAELAQANATLGHEVAERTQLGMRLQQQAIHSSALAALSQALAEAGRDLQPLFDTIVQRVSGLMNDACVLSLLSADQQWMHPVGSYSPDAEHSALLRALLAAGPDRTDAGWSAAVVASGHALLLPNIPIAAVRAQIDPRCHPDLETLDVLSLLIVPLRAQDTLIGTLTVIRDRQSHPYSADDQSFLQDLANRAGLAIENAHLFAAAERARAEAERANRAKSAFLASMSHELRTPLNAILGFTGTLLMRLPGPLNADQAKQLTTVQRSGKHLLALINDLLDLAKVESGKVELRLQPVICQEVLATMAESLRPLAEQKRLRFIVEAPDQPIVVASDARALGQILTNLVNNAIKFTDAGEVTVSLGRMTADEGAMITNPIGSPLVVGRSSFVAFTVRDTGIGIRAEDQARLFEEFGRVDSDAVREREGTGLGLRLSRKLAELLGARIELSSALGLGSTFTLVLPER